MVDMKKRFWVFAVADDSDYCGGHEGSSLNDVIGTFDSLDEAREFGKQNKKDEWGMTFFIELFDAEERIKIDLYTKEEREEKERLDSERIPCAYVYKRGKNIGLRCDKIVERRYLRCSKHNPRLF